MKQITDYQMVAATKGKDLEALVKEKLADGWQPYEAPFVMEVKEAYQPVTCIVQTMVRYKENYQRFIPASEPESISDDKQRGIDAEINTA